MRLYHSIPLYLGILLERERDRIHTVAFVGGVAETFAIEYMPKMAVAVMASDLGTFLVSSRDVPSQASCHQSGRSRRGSPRKTPASHTRYRTWSCSCTAAHRIQRTYTPRCRCVCSTRRSRRAPSLSAGAHGTSEYGPRTCSGLKTVRHSCSDFDMVVRTERVVMRVRAGNRARDTRRANRCMQVANCGAQATWLCREHSLPEVAQTTCSCPCPCSRAWPYPTRTCRRRRGWQEGAHGPCCARSFPNFGRIS